MSINDYTQRLDEEILELGKDSNRPLSIYSEILVEFACYLGLTKKKYIATKNTYDIKTKELKNEWELKLTEDRKILEEENNNSEFPIKLKDFKITDAELCRYAEFKLVDLHKEYKDLESEIESLQIIYDSYVRHYYSIRDDRNVVIGEQKFYS